MHSEEKDAGIHTGKRHTDEIANVVTAGLTYHRFGNYEPISGKFSHYNRIKFDGGGNKGKCNTEKEAKVASKQPPRIICVLQSFEMHSVCMANDLKWKECKSLTYFKEKLVLSVGVCVCCERWQIKSNLFAN